MFPVQRTCATTRTACETASVQASHSSEQETDGKALLIALVTKDLTNRFHAGNIAKKAATILGGSGGGRPDMAQAGGPEVGELDRALQSIEEFLAS